MKPAPHYRDAVPSTRARPVQAPPLTGRASLERAPHPRLDGGIRRATTALLDQQRPEGHWSYELEADCTIPAEYILMNHFTGEIEERLERKLAVYLRTRQAEHGGWPLYTDGAFDMSCSVKAYYALKLVGDSPAAPHMQRARAAILAHGGAARSNVFTRITLAQFQQVPWRATPFIPVELMLLPRWFPFHLSKISYWSRTVLVPLTILWTLRAQARNPRGVDIAELFTVPPEQERDYFPVRSRANRRLLALEQAVRRCEPLIPARLRRRALLAAERWVIARLNGTHGLGAIFPAMVNAYEALTLLGYRTDHHLRSAARQALRRLIVEHEDWAYCQPCVSPVWDTGLACLALQEAGEPGTGPPLRRALDWLEARQVCDRTGDWQWQRPGLPGGGWAFQYCNPAYPDLDDTAVVAWALQRQDPRRYGRAVALAADWIAGMQSANGGFASFDADNTHHYLNEIPFADHGALLDPPTADVSARCLLLLGRLGRNRDAAARRRCLAWLAGEQEADGSWFGRWGTNYIYGTWSVLAALEQLPDPVDPALRRRAARFFEATQHADGGWGENNDSYFRPEWAGRGQPSTAFQTAWAVLGLVAAGAGDSAAVRRGVAYLLRTQAPDGLWHDRAFTAPGFPRVFYLKYHGYDRYFPLWALARYRSWIDGCPR